MHIIEALYNGYIEDFIRHVEGAIKGQAYYLAALGLFVYTEIMGGFITGNLGKDRKSRANFERFLFGYGRRPLEVPSAESRQRGSAPGRGPPGFLSHPGHGGGTHRRTRTGRIRR